MRSYFDELVTWASTALHGDETLLAHMSGENSDFTRFNQAAIRQAGAVRQCHLSIDLIDGARHAEGSVTLAGVGEIDRPRVSALLGELRAATALAPEDPHLNYSIGDHSTERLVAGAVPSPTEAVDGVISGAAGRDLVGIYAAGEMFSGFASSFGQRNWFAASSFNVDWSLYLHSDKATKAMYAGADWDDAVLATKLRRSVQQLDILGRTPMKISPGSYRSFLAPAAVRELVEAIGWEGFGLRAHRTKRTSLLQMVTEGVELHPEVRLSENVAGGVAADFQSAGFSRPDEIVLIESGRYRNHLVSPRSAREYGVETNGADDWEVPESVDMAPGDLAIDDAVGALGTGLYIGNLNYLNFSDQARCRTTGLTRFGTFWVDGGEVVAPVEVMRFDDTIYHLLGDRLERLTDKSEMMLDSGTYDRRSTQSWRLPGALVEELTLTL